MSHCSEPGRPLYHPTMEQAARNRFTSEDLKLDRELDVLICPGGKELAFRNQHRKGGGTYWQYAPTAHNLMKWLGARGTHVFSRLCGPHKKMGALPNAMSRMQRLAAQTFETASRVAG